MRRMFICLMVLAIGFSPARAIDFPNDFPTIEALISLHKMIKGEEDAARDKIAVSFGEQSLVTKGANKFNDARTTLDSKLSNGYSYVLLAASLSYTASSMYKLIQEYSEFAQLSVQYSTKKPMVAWYFTEANLACSREIKNIKALYLTMTASGLNVMKASMDEKLNLVNSIKTSIDTMRGIIDSAYCWASIVAVGGFHYDYIWDILNSEVTDEIATGLINQWNKV
ncbi:hypothetical protein SAMN05216462_0371 [Xylanibacter ruminicola]|uniref:Uncharacterized protein n=2 Tax=Xylanibacter ruminicola TaxID=839 RepID=A0A1H3XWU5_XYLRU|nr:hypothetical protein SAMN05216462_0371 [Xylanibacter ruminicola]